MFQYRVNLNITNPNPANRWLSLQNLSKQQNPGRLPD